MNAGRARTAIAAACLVATGASCVVTAQPPEAPRDAATVYLVSEVGHTGLLLPREEGGWVEYAFGDFRWYVEGRGGQPYGLYTALFPTQGAFGRREFDAADPLEDPWVVERSSILYPLRVERARIATARRKLEEAFHAAGADPVYNELYGLWFVPAAERYTMWFNCTDATAAWLAELDVRADTGGIVQRIVGRRGTALLPPGAVDPREPRPAGTTDVATASREAQEKRRHAGAAGGVP